MYGIGSECALREIIFVVINRMYPTQELLRIFYVPLLIQQEVIIIIFNLPPMHIGKTSTTKYTQPTLPTYDDN